MMDEEIWLMLFHAAISTGVSTTGMAAEIADKGLAEYKKRWSNGD